MPSLEKLKKLVHDADTPQEVVHIVNRLVPLMIAEIEACRTWDYVCTTANVNDHTSGRFEDAAKNLKLARKRLDKA